MLVDLDTFNSRIIFYGFREEFYAENEENARQRATLPDSPLEGEKSWGMTVIQNTASNIIIKNFYPILDVVAEVEELQCF